LELIHIKNLSYSIGIKSVLEKVNCSISQKKRIALRGDNGSGKSTLLRCIVNYNMFENSIEWNKNISMDLDPLSYLGHELGLYNSLNMEENLRYFHSLSKTPRPWEKIKEWVKEFKLHLRWDDPLHIFSRGMKQKVALIRSLIPRSHLLLLDEPFTGLDQTSQSQIRDILKSISQETTVMAVVHDMEDPFWEESLFLEKGILYDSNAS
jgi:heme exporter protein A